jgi:eukaryotic-like serine/threonine-protein kinase
MQFWNELEGQTINGRYPLLRLVRSEGRSAWFETETGHPQSARATVSVTEALTDADEVFARLQAAQHLTHPNLVHITQVGQTSLDGTLLVYALMEPIEQSPSDVLQAQALSPEEGREVAEALVGALTAIHQTGMSHGRVEAASVLATAETVKLRSDCLHTNAAGQAEDIAGIGTTLFHAFTQRKALTATDAQINRIPAPFAEIIRNSFARRWTLAQIGSALRPALPVTNAVPAPAPPAPAAVAPPPEPVPVEVPAERLPRAERPVDPGPTPAPIPPVARALPVESEIPVGQRIPAGGLMDDLDPAKKTPYGLYAVLALVVLAIVGWLWLRPRSTPAPAPTQTEAAAPTSSPATSAPVPAPAVSAPKAPAAKASAAKPSASKAAAVVTATAEDHPVWRVVAYTYRSETMAADMVSKINEKHADLHPEVFKPHPKGTAFVVTVGGAMDHDGAEKMVSKAKRAGLPGDTYMQNFSE